jgi:hypothetical protein
LFRIAVIYQSQLQIFENHGYVSELVIWFSWRTALRTSSYQFHFGHLPNGGLFALYIRISLRTEFSVKPENWPSPSLPCFVDCVNICGHQNSLEQQVVLQLFSMERVSKKDPEELLREISQNGISQNVCINDLGTSSICPIRLPYM